MLGKVVDQYIDPADIRFKEDRNQRHPNPNSRMFVLGCDANFYTAYLSDVFGNHLPEVGAWVSFTPRRTGEYRRALHVRAMKTLKHSPDSINAIAEWRVDARSERSQRYFFAMPEVDRLENSDKCIVLGRKGTGKTAMSEHIAARAQSTPHVFVQRIGFSKFDFTEFYANGDGRPDAFGRFEVFWRYMILMEAAGLVATDDSVSPKFRAELTKFVGDTDADVSTQFRIWLGRIPTLLRDATSSVIGNVAQGATTAWLKHSMPTAPSLDVHIHTSVDTSQGTRPSASIDQACRALTSILRRAPRHPSRYFILFDQLDETYRRTGSLSTKDDRDYLAMMEGLILAAIHVRDEFRDSGPVLLPVVFMRDDIFEAIPATSAKHMWHDDHAITLHWDNDRLNRMIAFRLARARDAYASKAHFDPEWYSLIAERLPGYILSEKTQRDGAPFFNVRLKDKRDSHRFMSLHADTISRTQRTPRDFIVAVRAIAEVLRDDRTIRADEKVFLKAWTKASKTYFDQAVSELAAHVHKPEEVLRALAGVARSPFNYEMLEQKLIERGLVSSKEDAAALSDLLFQHGVLANVPPSQDRAANALIKSAISPETTEAAFVDNAPAPDGIPETIKADPPPPDREAMFVYLNSNFRLDLMRPMAIHRGLWRTLGINS